MPRFTTQEVQAALLSQVSEVARDLQWHVHQLCRSVLGKLPPLQQPKRYGQQDEGIGPNHLLECQNRLFASDEEGRDHVRKYDDVAQRQHRIGSGFTWRKRWAWLCVMAPSPLLLSLSAVTRL